MIVSVKSTVVLVEEDDGVTAWPFVGTLGADFADCLVGGAVGATGVGALGFCASGLRALLEMTNRRRTGGVLAGAGLPLRWLLDDALFGVVTLRFNINISDRENQFQFREITSPNAKSGF